MASHLVVLAIAVCFLADGSVFGLTFSSELIHRYSLMAENGVVLPEKRSLEYAQMTLKSDLQRQRMRFGSKYYNMVPLKGGQIRSYGNELGWLHYTWIDIGTPKVSFLVAVDVGSDLFWVPCECIQCASLSASHYAVLDRDLRDYQPSNSSTADKLSCGSQLCESSANCENSEDLCPYIVEYDSDDTSTSGYLVQENLHLASLGLNASEKGVQATVLVGCGRQQSGYLLEGAAPDGLMGLGPGTTSVPSLLAKADLVSNSFSICFGKDDSGRLVFGDQGPSSQHSTPFLTREGNYEAYFVRVESFCVGNTCSKQSGFRALVDTGTSFGTLPGAVYDKMVLQLEKQLPFKRISAQGELETCYNISSVENAKLPAMRLLFAENQSFSLHDFTMSNHEDKLCLTIMRSNQDYGIVGQNFMAGHLMVFDRENLTFGWSESDCQDSSNGTRSDKSPSLPPGGESPNPLPANEQQDKNNNSQAVSPAVAVRASPKRSLASESKIQLLLYSFCSLLLLVCFL